MNEPVANDIQVPIGPSQKMTIIWHSVAPWIRSGYGKGTKEIVTRLAKAGYRVIISAYYGVEPGGVLNYDGCPVLSSKEGSFGIASAAKYAQQFRANLGILFTDWWAFSDFPKLLPYPTLYGPMDHINYPEEILNFTRMYYRIIALCKFQTDYLASEGIKSTYIYHGVDTNIFKPMDKVAMKQRIGLTPETFVIGTVAANSDKEDRKSHTRSMKAIRYFLDENPDIKPGRDIVWIYHSVPNDPRGMPLQSIAHKFKLDNVIKFLDPRMADVMIPDEELAQLMNAFDVHLLCSKREGFGMPILETQSCGIPNICHNFSSMPELVEGHGWLCKSLGSGLNLETTPIVAETAFPDVYDIAAQFKDAYFSESKRKKYAIDSRKFAVQYSWDDLVSQYWIPTLQEIEQDMKPKSLQERKI